MKIKLCHESKTSFISVVTIDSSNTLPLAVRMAWNCCEMESAINTKSVMCLEVNKTIKSTQNVLL